MSDLKNAIQHMVDVLKGLEERARKLQNQNLADVAAAAHGRVAQLTEHADLHLVDEQKDQQAKPDGTPKDQPSASGPFTLPQQSAQNAQQF
jgi:hypothetical protein